jgi:hypothetical protein
MLVQQLRPPQPVIIMNAMIIITIRASSQTLSLVAFLGQFVMLLI